MKADKKKTVDNSFKATAAATSLAHAIAPDVLSPEDMELNLSREKLSERIVHHGAEIVRAMVTASDKFYSLCCLIRYHQADDDLVRESLEPLGFIKQRITEILRVAKASPQLWSEFEARSLSFKATLALTRGTVKLLSMVPENGEDGIVKPWMAEGAEKQHAEAIEAEEAAQSPREKRNLDVEAMDSAARKLAKLAEKLKKRTQTFVIENGYKVVVSKMKSVAKVKEID